MAKVCPRKFQAAKVCPSIETFWTPDTLRPRAIALGKFRFYLRPVAQATNGVTFTTAGIGRPKGLPSTTRGPSRGSYILKVDRATRSRESVPDSLKAPISPPEGGSADIAAFLLPRGGGARWERFSADCQKTRFGSEGAHLAQWLPFWLPRRQPSGRSDQPLPDRPPSYAPASKRYKLGNPAGGAANQGGTDDTPEMERTKHTGRGC